MNPRACKDCEFWDAPTVVELKQQGACKRYPPECAGVIPQQDMAGRITPSVVTSLPYTKGDDWCGEWKAKIRLVN